MCKYQYIMVKKQIREEISERFIQACDKLIRKYNYKSDAQFAKELNMHVQIFSNIRNKKRQVGIEVISSFLTLFPEVDGNWLIKGEDNIPSKVDLEKLVGDKINEVLGIDTLANKEKLKLEKLIEDKINEALEKRANS